MSEARNQMIKTTSQLIRRGGYSGVAVSEMLRASGVPKGSLYYHFPGGKEELGVAAIERSGRAVSRAIEQALKAGHGDLAATYRRMATVLAANLENSGWLDGCPMATTALEDSVQSQAIGAACRRVLDAWLEPIIDAFAAYGLAGRQAQDEADFVMSAFEGALIVARVRRDSRPLRTAAAMLAARLPDAPEASHPAPRHPHRR
jgi:TetR/AcrR family transcriptional regulator, lmrAB and yxaGH operons repressor